MTSKFVAAVSLFALGLSVQAAPAAAGPFTGYQGSWSGSGTISTNNGDERIRCRASYAVDGTGSSLTQRLTCASDSYRFVVVSDIIANGSSISGTWSETTRSLNGALSGSAAGGHYNARVSGGGFNANVSVSSSSSRQTVVISSGASSIRRVSMTLQKGG